MIQILTESFSIGCTVYRIDKRWSAWCISFPSVFGVDTSINSKNITTIPYHFISTLLNANFDFDISVTNEVAIDVTNCALPGRVMQGLPCPEVRTWTNENGRYIMKNKWLLSPPMKSDNRYDVITFSTNEI